MFEQEILPKHKGNIAEAIADIVVCKLGASFQTTVTAETLLGMLENNDLGAAATAIRSTPTYQRLAAA